VRCFRRAARRCCSCCCSCCPVLPVLLALMLLMQVGDDDHDAYKLYRFFLHYGESTFTPIVVRIIGGKATQVVVWLVLLLQLL